MNFFVQVSPLRHTWSSQGWPGPLTCALLSALGFSWEWVVILVAGSLLKVKNVNLNCFSVFSLALNWQSCKPFHVCMCICIWFSCICIHVAGLYSYLVQFTTWLNDSLTVVACLPCSLGTICYYQNKYFFFFSRHDNLQFPWQLKKKNWLINPWWY